MQAGHSSRTALGAARHRAGHQVLERGFIFSDPFALPILGIGADAIIQDTQDDEFTRKLRLFIAVRSRLAEDALAAAVSRGVVSSTQAIEKKSGIARQTPRVSIAINRTALAKRPLGRSELKRFTDWKDGRPETELNFKFYRQATNKIAGISDATAAFLDRFFSS
jgi:hypothetical protein